MAWETRTAMPTVWAHVDVAAYGGLIYVHRWDDATSSSIQVYDPAADSWSTIALPSANIDRQGGLCADDTYLYLFGGQNGASPFQTTECWGWDGSWHALNALPEARRNCPTSSDGTTQAIVGGTRQALNGDYRDNFWTRTSGAWSVGTVAPRARSAISHQIAAVAGKVYVPGGLLLGAVVTDLFDIGTIGGSWASGAVLDEPLYQYGMAADDDHLYVVGGNDGSAPFELLTRRYTIATDTWDTDLDNLPDDRQLNDCAIVGNYLYSIGGATSASGVGGDGAVLRLNLAGGMHVGYVAMG